MSCLSGLKIVWGIVEFAILAAGLAAFGAIPATIKIPDSTPVMLTLMDRLNSATSEIDDAVHFEVAEDVKVKGIVAIPRGCLASGHVLAVQHRGRWGQPGKLEFSVDFIRAPDGTDISVRGQAVRKGKSARSGLPTPMHILAKGKDLEIPQGTHLLVYTNGGHEILADTNAPPAEFQTPAQVKTEAPSGDISSVAVTSNPNHANITVDGKFLGTTPSTVRIASGDHSVTIEKEGFKAWQRVLTLIPGGSITLDVSLDKVP